MTSKCALRNGAPSRGMVTISPQRATTATTTRRSALRTNRNRSRLKAVSEAYIDCLRLDQYEKHPFVASNGWIAPMRDPSANAFVFAVFDLDDSLQFIGFSKDIRASLRNVYYRQPDKCHFYRFVDLPDLDQKQMAGIRDTWLLQEDGRVPPGLGSDKQLWIKPPQGDESTWLSMMDDMRSRGLKEDMEINMDKLQSEGVIDLLPSKHEFTPQEIEAREAKEKYDREHTFSVSQTFGNKNIEFTLYIAMDFKSKGGHMLDVDITMGDKTTSHRITVSDHFLELVNVELPVVLQRSFVYLFAKGSKRSTDRNSPADIKDFPINYFSLNQIDQLYPGFGEMFPEGRVPKQDELWGFNRKTVTGSVLMEDKPLKGMPLLGPEHDFGGNRKDGEAASSISITPTEDIGMELELESIAAKDNPDRASNPTSDDTVNA